MIIYLGHIGAWVSITFLAFLIRGKGTYNFFTWIVFSAILAIFSTMAQVCLF